MEVNAIRRFPDSTVTALILVALVALALTGNIAAAQSFNVLSSLTTASGYDPVAPLLQGTDGNFYGVTLRGGNMTACQVKGCGTIFQITPAGILTVIHAFTGDNDGFDPSVRPD